MAGKPRKDRVAAAAAAAATAAVKATQNEGVKLIGSWVDGDDDEEGDEELREEIIAGLEQLDEEGGGGLKWELYLDTPADKAGQIRELMTSELRHVRAECLSYGPGMYHVIARNSQGAFQKGTRKNIKISHFAKTTSTLPNSPGPDPLALIQQMEDRAEKRRLEAKRERDQNIKFWAPILAPIGVELAKGLLGRGGGDSVKDIVAALVGMKDLMGGDKKSEVDTLLKGIELARDLAPESSKGSTWQDVLLNGVRELRPLAENLVNRQNGKTTGNGAVQFQTATALPAPASGGNGAGSTPSTAASAAEDPMWSLIEPLLQRLGAELEEYAVNGAQAELAAEALLAKVPRILSSQIQPQQMKEWLSQANWWELTQKFRPTLSPYEGFCDDVRLTLLQIFENQINPPADDGEQASAS